jgi:large subunit ribosomal protein L4e
LKEAIKILKQVGAYADAEKAKDSVQIRPGKGKMRNRRYINLASSIGSYEQLIQ